MPNSRKRPDPTAREDDYRDYDDRDIGEGWPYSDQDSVRRDPNSPYGSSVSNFDKSNGPGIEVSTNPVIRSSGGPRKNHEAALDAIADDDIEERIYAVLEADKNLNTTGISVTVHNGVAELSGRVERQEDRVHIGRAVLAVSGVRDIADDLITIAADSHIPPDADE